jgi:hypothetical protein
MILHPSLRPPLFRAAKPFGEYSRPVRKNYAAIRCRCAGGLDSFSRCHILRAQITILTLLASPHFHFSLWRAESFCRNGRLLMPRDRIYSWCLQGSAVLEANDPQQDALRSSVAEALNNAQFSGRCTCVRGAFTSRLPRSQISEPRKSKRQQAARRDRPLTIPLFATRLLQCRIQRHAGELTLR